MFKKFAVITLILCLVLSFAGCRKRYEPGNWQEQEEVEVDINTPDLARVLQNPTAAFYAEDNLLYGLMPDGTEVVVFDGEGNSVQNVQYDDTYICLQADTVYVINRAQADVTQLAYLGYYDLFFGEWIYYVQGTIGDKTLMRINLVSFGEQNVANFYGIPADGHYAWTSNGINIYYFLFSPDEQHPVDREGLYVCDMDGSNVRLIAEADADINNSVGSLVAVNEYLYFATRQGTSETAVLYRFHIDSARIESITDTVSVTPSGGVYRIWLEGDYICFYGNKNGTEQLAGYNYYTDKVEWF